ncbi:MAG: hypothetical protein LIR50_10255 [Bacillota bacterium]|nr:hypothetical protein [Bacillota bacterium]
MITMNDVREFVEKMLTHAKECSSADMVMNCRAQAFGVIMFAQKFIPYDELIDYWENQGIWQKFNDIAGEKNK